jgi:hypothetical protein
MRRGTLRILATFGIAVALSACGSSDDSDPNGGGGGGNNPPGTPTGNPTTTPKTPEEQVKEILDARKTDYGEALRTATLKLADRLPTLAEIKAIETAADNNAKKAAYEKQIDTLIASPDFTRTMVKYWKDTMRMGQVGAVQNAVNKDCAPNFAAQLTVEGKDLRGLFTATAGTCPTVDMTTGVFTAADVGLATGAVAGPTVGIMTDPGVMAQYYGNLAFRRSRFFQETFACSKYPSEYSDKPIPMGSGTYTGPGPFESISGKKNNPAARIDFHDTSAVICANCHITLNKRAPLWMNWNMNGALLATPQVEVPIPGNPKATRLDYLPASESFAYKNGKPVTDLAGLGAAFAADPEIGRCFVNRTWNYAMSRGDIVYDVAAVPTGVTQPYVDKFAAGNYNLKATIAEVFKSEDFTKF